MVQPINFDKPIYNAVNINIRKPEVNAGQNDNVTNPTNVNNDNGIYNAVKIDIDKPRVNTQPVYDYPEADGIVTYEMLNFNPIQLDNKDNKENKNVLAEDAQAEEVTEEVNVPAPNYTTVETEKKNSNLAKGLNFHGAEEAVKKPEIVPSEDIVPQVDISLVTENLKSNDKDVQAQQIEEILRTVILDENKAKNYLVSDVFTELINITEEDATKFPGPTTAQVEARQKLIANIIAVEKDKKAINNLPYKMSDKEVAFAAQLSPMELVERNKEYAITTIGALAELFIEDYEAKEGHIVPITDTPGVSAIVNALRKDPNPSVKLASIDALRHIKRPEYKEELVALFTLAQSDPNPNVSRAAAISLNELS